MSYVAEGTCPGGIPSYSYGLQQPLALLHTLFMLFSVILGSGGNLNANMILLVAGLQGIELMAVFSMLVSWLEGKEGKTFDLLHQ